MTTNPVDATTDDPRLPALACRAVLVPLDGSPLAERALGPAAWLADRLDAEVHVIVAGIGRDELWWYHRYTEEVARGHPGTTAHTSDDPDIARAVREMGDAVGPTVVCAATHGRGRAAGVTGSTFLSLLCASRAPAVAIGPACSVPQNDSRPVVVCLDGTPRSASVLPSAAAWARRLGLHVRIVTVASQGVHPIGPDTTTGRTAFGPTDPVGYTEAIVTRPVLAGLSMDTQVIWDPTSPHKAVLDLLKRRPATLVAVASHVRVGLPRLVLGSEAGAIVRGSPVPVLVHPATGRPEGLR